VARDARSAAIIGQVLLQAREQAGLTQEMLAARTGMDRSYLSDVERGEASLSLHRFLKICAGVGMSGSKLLAKIEKAIAAAD
jgi:transcriptional regulator with XRE-family HTH domain